MLGVKTILLIRRIIERETDRSTDNKEEKGLPESWFT